MKKFPVISRALNRVTNGMSEVQDGAFAGAIVLVARDDFRFYLNVATNKLLEDKRSPQRSCLPRLKLPEHFRLSDNRVLDNFCESLVELATRQRLQNIQIIDHQRRLMHRTDQIFSVDSIHSGLSADRAIDHCKQRRGNLNMRNAAMINRCDKSGDITNHAAPEADYK